MIRRSWFRPIALVSAGALTALCLHSASASITDNLTLHHAYIQAAPSSPTGEEAALIYADSAVSLTVDVSSNSKVVIAANAEYCDGWPVLDVTDDGDEFRTFAVSNLSGYRAYTLVPVLDPGTHHLNVAFANDYNDPGRCDRNVYIASVTTISTSSSTPPNPPPSDPTPTPSPSPSPPTTNPSGGKPGASNTGVPAGTNLTRYDGDMVIKTAGTVIDGLDIYGEVQVQANNVTIRRSFIHGGSASSSNIALISSYWGNTGLLIQDSTLKPDHPSYYLDGLVGANFTANRVEITGVVDTAKTSGSNVTITNSWLHANSHYNNDPLQSDGKSHDDSFQTTGNATNIVLKNNTFEGADNSAIMISQSAGPAGNITVDGNWLSGGACTVNVTQASLGTTIKGLSITDNEFGMSKNQDRCPMRLPSSSPIHVSDNTWESSGSPVSPNWF